MAFAGIERDAEQGLALGVGKTGDTWQEHQRVSSQALRGQ